MQQQQTSAGPLTTPKALRRTTGAHAILIALTLADLGGLLITLFIGTLLGPPAWWALQEFVALLHASLLLGIGLALILFSGATASIRQHMLKEKTKDTWGCTGLLTIGWLIATFIAFAIIKFPWMMIPDQAIPAVTVEPIHWPPPLSFFGLACATATVALAHLVVYRRGRRETAEKLRTFSHAHPGGPLCDLLDQVYGFYQHGQARFVHLPVKHLKTPPMCHFYPRTPPADGKDEQDTLAHPERDLYLVGRELVICQAHLGPKPEQTAILLPLVARLLHDYNSPVTRVESLLHLAELAKSSVFCSWVLLVPIIVAQHYAQIWQEMEPDRVLDRDRFAWVCGEGKRLRNVLYQRLNYLHRTNQPDNTVPTLAERMDHLDSLLGSEAHQVKKLREALPPATTK